MYAGNKEAAERLGEHGEMTIAWGNILLRPQIALHWFKIGMLHGFYGFYGF